MAIEEIIYKNNDKISNDNNLFYEEVNDIENNNILFDNFNLSFEGNNELNNGINNEMNISNISEIKNINNNFEELKINKMEDINKNFEIIKTTGNGNCLFESLISCMNDDKNLKILNQINLDLLLI